MGARSRSKNMSVVVSGTTYRRYVGTLTRTRTHGHTVTTEDTIGNYNADNAFKSERKFYVYPLLNGERYYNGILEEGFYNAPIGWYGTAPSASGWFPIDAVQLQALIQGAVSSVSPGSAVVNLPAFLGELKEFPGMFRVFHGARLAELPGKLLVPPKLLRTKLGDLLGSLRDQPLDWAAALGGQVGHSNLWWRFGVVPFVSDLGKLIGFMDAVAKRLKELEKLRDKGRLRKNVVLRRDSWAGPVYSMTLESNSLASTITGTRQERAKAKRWLSIEWRLTPGTVIPSGGQELYDAALLSMLGMNLNGLIGAAWELTPWSWLIDWFANIGNFLNVNGQALSIYVSRLCLMMKTQTSVDIVVCKKPTWISLKGKYEIWSTLKTRTPVTSLMAYAPPLPHLPILTNGQAGILGSLAATKARFPRK